MVRCGIFAASIWNERFNLLMFTLLCAISIQILKFFCKDRRWLLYMSRTLHLFGTDWCAMMVPNAVLWWYRFMRYSGTDSPILSFEAKMPSPSKLIGVIQRIKGNDQRLVVPLYSFRGNCIRCICHLWFSHQLSACGNWWWGGTGRWCQRQNTGSPISHKKE